MALSCFTIDALMRKDVPKDEEKIDFKEPPRSPTPKCSSPGIGTAEPDRPSSPDADSEDPPEDEPPDPPPASLKAPINKITCPRMLIVGCRLEGAEMWRCFHKEGTEMIITKAGRRMFPTIRVAFTDLDPCERYDVYVDIEPSDDKRYRYAYHKSGWQVAGKCDPATPYRIYRHPDSPFSGDMLMKQVVSFEKVKLTNDTSNQEGHVILNSMHKYCPRVHIALHGRPFAPKSFDFEAPLAKTFVFNVMEFTAVTAYQNQRITTLKISYNPFAKGFRDNNRSADFEGVVASELRGAMMFPSFVPRFHPYGRPPPFSLPLDKSLPQMHSVFQSYSNLMLQQSPFPVSLPNPMPTDPYLLLARLSESATARLQANARVTPVPSPRASPRRASHDASPRRASPDASPGASPQQSVPVDRAESTATSPSGVEWRRSPETVKGGQVEKPTTSENED